MDIRHLADEQRHADSNAPNGSGAVLLKDKHEDGKDQLSREEELKEEGLGDTDAAVQSGGGVEATAGHDSVGQSGSCETASYLGNEYKTQTDDIDGTGSEHGDGDGGVEHAASDAEESPAVELVSVLPVPKHVLDQILSELELLDETYQTLTIKDIPKAKEMYRS